MNRRVAYSALAFVCAVPRFGVLLHVRDVITGSNAEKSDLFAQLFVAHGTYGLIPGEPSAYTQPLYGWFLIPVYWIFGRSWVSIGLSQIALAVVTAWLVYEIGRRVIGPRAGLVGAAIATLNPYLVWHDVHVNREIVDQVCAAALVLLTLMVAERPSRKLATLLGAVTGLAMLGNTRLVFIPILCAVYLAFRLPRARASALACGLVLVGAGVVVAPWLIRTRTTSVAGRSRPTGARCGRRTTLARTGCSPRASGSTTSAERPPASAAWPHHAGRGPRASTNRCTAASCPIPTNASR